jgi:hypothetical protein
MGACTLYHTVSPLISNIITQPYDNDDEDDHFPHKIPLINKHLTCNAHCVLLYNAAMPRPCEDLQAQA